MKGAMKHIRFLCVAVVGVVLTCASLSGCGKAEKPAPADQPKSTGQTVLEGVTGKTAVDQGQAAKKQLQAIDQMRRKEMEALEQ